MTIPAIAPPSNAGAAFVAAVAPPTAEGAKVGAVAGGPVYAVGGTVAPFRVGAGVGFLVGLLDGLQNEQNNGEKSCGSKIIIISRHLSE